MASPQRQDARARARVRHRAPRALDTWHRSHLSPCQLAERARTCRAARPPARPARARRPRAQALALFDAMPSLGLRQTVRTYNAAISACRRARDSARALALLRQMQAAGGSLSPTAISYNAAIAASEWSGSAELALALLDEMRAAGLMPDGHSCVHGGARAALRPRMRCAAAARAHLAALTPRAALADIPTRQSPRCAAPHCPPARRRPAVAHSRRRPPAAWTMRRMPPQAHHLTVAAARPPAPSARPARRGVTWRRYAAAITACGRCADGRAALALFEQMRDAGLVPDIVTTTALISAAARSGEWRAALVAFDAIPTRARSRPAFAAALSACARGGQRARARALLGEMRAAGFAPGVREATMAAAACKADGAWKEAVEILCELEAGGGGAQGGGVRADAHALRTVYQIARGAAAGSDDGADAAEAGAAADALLKRLLTDGAIVDDTERPASGDGAELGAAVGADDALLSPEEEDVAFDTPPPRAPPRAPRRVPRAGPSRA